jgi:hypothetical protein
MPTELNRREAIKAGLLTVLGLGIVRPENEANETEAFASVVPDAGHYTALYDVPWDQSDPFLQSLIGTVNRSPLFGMPTGTIVCNKIEPGTRSGTINFNLWYRPRGWDRVPASDYSPIETAWRARDD